MQRVETHYIKSITKDEIELLLSAIPSLRVKTCLRVMQYCGLRVSDAVAIQLNYFVGDSLRVPMIKAKGRIIELPINSKLKLILTDYFKRFTLSRDNPYLFQFKKFHIKESTIRHAIYKARQKTGLTDWYYECRDKHKKKLYRISSHTLRHYFINSVNEVSDLFTAKEMAGHIKIETTIKYLNKIKMEKKKEVAEMIM
jgi:integrase